MSNASVPLRCKCRRKAVTSLRCSRCSIPICPDCSKVAPVGMLCRECASDGRSPLVQVAPGPLVLSIVACLGVASLGGWLLLTTMFGFFGLVLSYALGTAVAEIALRITGRKRGAKMEVLAGACTAIGMAATGLVISPIFFSLWPIAMVGVATVAAVNRIRYI